MTPRKGRASLLRIVISLSVNLGGTPEGSRRKGLRYPGTIAGNKSASTGRGSYPHQSENRGPNPSNNLSASSASLTSPGNLRSSPSSV
ncbi:Os04g0464850 [Oryza sativa Japonica Group]|uniref:Os04g0464850 protein n=1 Tax=Oryza sativa subsp. japonica TaxID=39947 RepID=A0A0P0WBA9_ORYSJ|nr:hypothetical protein EE612_023810 [Oryza sativa]BAS89590.1 Os04g0464850 [Oryza sativa Japonica Group]